MQHCSQNPRGSQPHLRPPATPTPAFPGALKGIREKRSRYQTFLNHPTLNQCLKMPRSRKRKGETYIIPGKRSKPTSLQMTWFRRELGRRKDRL